jgi:myo-inositol 2-dehydrogenase / D-chiro-inositol 1-dehydrogenase
MSENVKLGIIGLGRLGLEHANNIHYAVAEAEVAAVCSIVDEELEKAKKLFSPKKVTRDYRELLQDRSLDGIVITTNSQTHCRIICDAAESGVKHLFTEKPIGMTMEEIDAIKAAVSSRPDMLFQVGYNHRFDRSLMAARRKVAEGYVGDLVLIRIESRDQLGIEEFIVKFSPSSGGFIADMMTHDYDTARWFTGSEAEVIFGLGGVYAYEGLKACGDMDNTAVLMRFRSGVMVLLTASRNSGYGYHAPMEIFGTKGAIRIGDYSHADRNVYLDERGAGAECASWFYEYWKDTYLAEIEDFVRCIRTGDEPKVGLLDGYKAMEWAFKAHEAVSQQKVVTM